MMVSIATASSIGLLFHLSLQVTICLSNTLNVEAAASVDLPGANAAAEVIVKDLNKYQFATKGLPHPSTQCLTSSVAMMAQWLSETSREGIVDSGEHYCASMTVEQRELLALELTYCQLMKQRRSIFRHGKFSHLDRDHFSSLFSNDSSINVCDNSHDEDIERLCPIGTLSADSPYNPSNCLPFLSEYASLIYNQFYLYTDEICSRLTESLIIQRKEELYLMLVNASSSVAQHIDLLEDHSIAMQELQSIYDSRKLQEQEIMQIIQSNSLQMKKDFHEAQQIFRELEMESERMHLRTQKDSEKMLEVISKASSLIQPLSSIESLVTTGISGFSIIKSLVVFILSVNVAWMLTTLTSTQRARRYIVVILIAEVLFEVSVVLLVDLSMYFGVNDEDMIKLARYLAWGSCGLVLTSFFVTSFFMTPQKDAVEVMSVEDSLQMNLSLLTKMNDARDLVLAYRAIENNLDIGRERLEKRFDRYNRQPKYQRRRYKPRRRTFPDRGIPVVTPTKPRCTTSSALKPTAHNVQDAPGSSTSRNCNQINHRPYVNTNDTSDSYDVNSSSGDESSDYKKPLAIKTVKRKRKLSDLESSSDDDDNFMSARSSSVSLPKSVMKKIGGSASSMSTGEDSSPCGKKRKGSIA